MSADEELAEEAAAFNQRIVERRDAGFIPDLRRAVKSSYFYKSFWRDPHYIDLYLGRMMQTFISLLQKHAPPGARVLDAGCGAGYFSLELARAGYHVVGFDFADMAIAAAREAAESNPYKEGFGSLRYEVWSMAEATGRFDVVLASGVLHHLVDLRGALSHLHSLLDDDGIIIGYEPCHERWRPEDAAQVALMRGLLHLTGHWYEAPDDGAALDDVTAFDRWVDEVHTEYVEERDKNEVGGQSPHDLEFSGEEILTELARSFQLCEHLPGSAFIYRFLGGLRGEDELTHRMADFITMYERYAVDKGFMQPNGFYFAARKT